MKTLNHSKARIISQPTSFSSAVSRRSCTEPLRGSIKRILIAAGLATAVAAPAWAAQLPDVAGSSNTEAASILAGQDTDGAVDSESVAQAEWRASMGQNPTPAEGCFHASYPNIVWEKVECMTGQPRAHPVHVKPTDPEAETVGNGYDYVAKAKGLITIATGSFDIKGVTSEQGVGVAKYHNDGILGPNDYSLQINTNDLLTTDACAGGNGDCHVWQQFVYATDFGVSTQTGKTIAGLLMQYWLLDYGSGCPSGWSSHGNDCYKDSKIGGLLNVPPADLGKVVLQATASPGGNDSVTFQYKTDLYNITASDSVLDIGSVWDKAEFNVVGDAGGSRADFNKGSSITVKLELGDGSRSAPTCVANDGTTGETNNLNLGKCAAFSSPNPRIQFTESN
jgi:hypothetical protein